MTKPDFGELFGRIFVIGWLSFIVVFFAISVGSTIFSALGFDAPKCTRELVTYSKYANEDPNLTEEQSTTTPGKPGEDNVCRKNGKEVSRETIVAPVPEMITRGTKQPEPTITYDMPVYEAPIEDTGYAVICNDGTGSYSTGRGTCSWHGGVSYYVY